MNEQGDEDDGSDKDFLPEAITLPDLDETLSGSECEEPPVQILQKHGRGRPLKAQVPDSAQGNVIFFFCWTHFIHTEFAFWVPSGCSTGSGRLTMPMSALFEEVIKATHSEMECDNVNVKLELKYKWRTLELHLSILSVRRIGLG